MIYDSILTLQDKYRKKELTSTQLVTSLLARIEQHDPSVNAVTLIAPDAKAQAKALDKEREAQGPRGPLHGIPVLLKDNINTKDMPTTAGSLALKDLTPPYEATLVQNLKKAGAIILGKVNLSEFAYFMSMKKMPSGFSSLKGQVKSPYHDKIDPLGSSTGSAVSVAMGFAPVAIGTETNGSIIAPSYQNGVVGIKPTVGLVSRHGIIPISAVQDTAGPIARTVRDAALILEYIKGRDAYDHATLNNPNTSLDYATSYKNPIKNLRVGLLKIKGYDYQEEDLKLMRELKQIYKPLGVIIEEIVYETVECPNEASMLYEFKHSLNAYLESVEGHTVMKTLKDIVAFYEADPEGRMPYGHDTLAAAEATSGDLSSEDYQQKRTAVVAAAKTFEALYEQHELDAMVSLHWLPYGPVLGHPSVVVPAKKLIDDKPKSFVFTATQWQEPRLIGLAYAYEQATLRFSPPKAYNTSK
mgnify:CR=1 FL=1